MRAITRRLAALEAKIGEPERRAVWCVETNAEMIASCRWLDTSTEIEERGDPIPDTFTDGVRLNMLNRLRDMHGLLPVPVLPDESRTLEARALAEYRAFFAGRRAEAS